MTDSVTGTTTSTSSSTALSASAAKDLGSLTSDYTTFLNLLTTQLKNQDPLSPMDTNQFTQQLVAFSGVEQQIKGNSKLDSLISLQQSANGLTSMLGYIGKSGEISSSTLYKTDNGANFSYTLPDSADNVTVNITDSSGAVVKTTSGASGTVGKHMLSWDGTDNDGQAVANGQYNINVTATKADGSALANVTTSAYGTITALENGASGISLYMGTIKTDASKLLAVGS